ncbi:hypothetical protein LBYZC6_45550 [Lacrimispora brassicae]
MSCQFPRLFFWKSERQSGKPEHIFNNVVKKSFVFKCLKADGFGWFQTGYHDWEWGYVERQTGKDYFFTKK